MTYRHKSVVWIGLVGALSLVLVRVHGELGVRTSMILLTVAFACELIDSGLGMGYGTILTPTLLLMGFEPETVVPAILLSELLTGFTAAFFHHTIQNVELGLRGRHLKPAMLLVGGSVAGVVAGVALAVRLPQDVLAVAIGWIILGSGVVVLVFSTRVIQYRNWKMLLLAGVASFNKAVSGGGYGPLVTSGQILCGVQGKSAVGITSFAEGFTCLLAVVLFTLKGGAVTTAILIPLCAGALVSVPFSVVVVNRAREENLRRFIGLLTVVLGALTIYKAMS